MLSRVHSHNNGPSKMVTRSTRSSSRGVFKDVTNTSRAGNGRVRKFSKNEKASTKRVQSSRSRNAFENEEPSRKKRKSEPSSDAMVVVSEVNEVAIPAPIEHEEIDLYDGDDPQAVTEYVNDIYEYMRTIEVRLYAKKILFSHSLTLARISCKPLLHGQPGRHKRENACYSA